MTTSQPSSIGNTFVEERGQNKLQSYVTDDEPERVRQPRRAQVPASETDLLDSFPSLVRETWSLAKELELTEVSSTGQFYKSVDPGLVKINPYSEKLRLVDVKIQLCAIPRQNVMTKDNVAVDIDSVIYYHIVNPYKAAYGISDVRQALIERSQTTLRHVVGSRNLQSVLTDREAVAGEIEGIVESISEKWGVSIESILIKDIVFSQELQQSLSSAAQQKRIGESKVIAARAEVDSAKLMREAADILSSPAAIQVITIYRSHDLD
ncbi:hypothetical protein P7C70_g431, partial [Phenoliferia sp. Uapishka_3]